jgi:hypothetical protein
LDGLFEGCDDVLVFAEVQIELLLLDVQPLGVVIASAEPHKVQAQLAEALELGVGVLVVGAGSAQGDGEAGGEPEGYFVGGRAFGGAVEGAGVGVHAAEGFDGVLLVEPLVVAAEPPVGEVRFGDGLAFKLGIQQSLDLGQGVEPEEDLLAFLAILEAKVNLPANEPRQPSDFAISCHKSFFFLARLTAISRD